MFKVGDIVVLKSGGPRMTVNGVDTVSAYVKWFLDGQVMEAKFAFAALSKEG